MKKSDYAAMFTLRKDGRYQAAYKDDSGKWRSLCDKDPERLFHKLEEIKKPRPVTFKQAAEAWQKEYIESCNPRTWTNYKPHYEDIVSKHGEINIVDVAGVDIIQDLQRAKAMGYSRTVVNTRRVIYNSVLNYAVAQGWVPWNVATGVRLPKGLPSGKRNAPTDVQIHTIIQNYNQPFGMFAFLLLCTGLRKGEALALLTSDIKDGEITVSKSLTLLDGDRPKVKEPKSKAGERTVPILSILQNPLDDYIAKLDGEMLFPSRGYNGSPDGQYMTQSNYDTAWNNYVKSVGLDGLTAHQLRHGTATLLYEAGVDVYTARKILGHSKVTTTMEIYTELREKKEKQSISKLNVFMADFVAKTR